jgi:hypothetical protein
MQVHNNSQSVPQSGIKKIPHILEQLLTLKREKLISLKNSKLHDSEKGIMRFQGIANGA